MQRKKVKSKVKHGKYICVSFIRFVSALTIFSIALIGSSFYTFSRSTQVLGTEVSVYSNQQCSFLNIFCFIQAIFHKSIPQQPPQTISLPIPTVQEGMQETISSTPINSYGQSRISGYQLYTDNVFHFSIQYPEDWNRLSELPSTIQGSNGVWKLGPTGTPEQQHSFTMMAPPTALPATKAPDGGYIVSKANMQKNEYNLNLLLENNDQHLSITDFINSVEIPPLQNLNRAYNWTVTFNIYTKQYGKNVATVVEMSKVNKTLNINQTGITAVYFANGGTVFKFSPIPSLQDNPTWSTINTTIISSLSFQ